MARPPPAAAAVAAAPAAAAPVGAPVVAGAAAASPWQNDGVAALGASGAAAADGLPGWSPWLGPIAPSALVPRRATPGCPSTPFRSGPGPGPDPDLSPDPDPCVEAAPAPACAVVREAAARRVREVREGRGRSSALREARRAGCAQSGPSLPHRVMVDRGANSQRPPTVAAQLPLLSRGTARAPLRHGLHRPADRRPGHLPTQQPQTPRGSPTPAAALGLEARGCSGAGRLLCLHFRTGNRRRARPGGSWA